MSTFCSRHLTVPSSALYWEVPLLTSVPRRPPSGTSPITATSTAWMRWLQEPG